LLSRHRKEKESKRSISVSTANSAFSKAGFIMLTVPDGGSREEEPKPVPVSAIRTPSRFSRSVTLAAVPFSESARIAAAAAAAEAAANEALDQSADPNNK
ncbi:hypothetical protein PENTCL1PPCAC_7326, partial [Pristionchus entomophagus]